MRKPRGWIGNEEISQVSVNKPSGIIFSFHGSVMFLKWVSSIGCVEGYKIYGGKDENNLESIGESNNTQFSKLLSENDFPYFVSVTAFFQNNVSEKSQVMKIREAIVNNNHIQENILNHNEILHLMPNIELVQQQLENNNNKKENIPGLPYGLCSCCTFPQPLMRRKENIVCSSNPKKIYVQNSGKWVLKPQTILSDVEQMDEILRQNSAFVGLGGILVNKRN